MAVIAPTQNQRKAQLVLNALCGSRVTFFYQSTDLKLQWFENLPAGMSARELLGKTDDDMLTPEIAAISKAAKRDAMQRRVRRTIEVPFGEPPDTRWFEMQIVPDVREDGSVDGIVCTVIDITDHKHHETLLRSLLREVSHRSKNLLAIILSVANQTARASGDKEDFLRRFLGRVQSIAGSQDLITESNWRGARLFELINQQVFAHVDDAADQIDVSGENIELVPNASMHIGLALHELATNSLAHGALSRPGGRVHISAAFDRSGKTPRPARLVWEETGGPPPPARRNDQFGTATLERIVPASLNGSGELHLDAPGARYELKFGPENIHADSRAVQA